MMFNALQQGLRFLKKVMPFGNIVSREENILHPYLCISVTSYILFFFENNEKIRVDKVDDYNNNNIYVIITI